MKSQFAVSAEQRKKIDSLAKAFKECEEAGLQFLVSDSGSLRAFSNPGSEIQVCRPYLGDEMPPQKQIVTDKVAKDAVTVRVNALHVVCGEDEIYV